MLTIENQYEDLKILYMGSGYTTSDMNCGYDSYVFAVRKQYLLEWLKSITQDKADEDYMERWLREEYGSDDSYMFYVAAKEDDEIVFEGPVYPDGNVSRCLYTVRDELRCDGEYEDQMYLQTTDVDEALKRFDEEVKKVNKRIADGEFFLKDVDGEERTRIADDLPALEFKDDEGNYYCLYVASSEFTDGRK